MSSSARRDTVCQIKLLLVWYVFIDKKYFKTYTEYKEAFYLTNDFVLSGINIMFSVYLLFWYTKCIFTHIYLDVNT